jgi:hypothetical protein
VVDGFEAIEGARGNWPADPIGAIGTDAILTAVNTRVAAYRVDGSTLLAPTRLADLVRFPNGTELFDPKVIYDQYADHFVLVYLAVHDGRERSWIVIVPIPEGEVADPLEWCPIKAPGDGVRGNGRQWSDYPGLGYDEHAVTVTANAFHFRRQRFAYAQILRFGKDTFYDPTCETTPPYAHFWGRATRNPDGSKAFTIQPAASVGAQAPSQLLVSYQRSRDTSAVVLWRIRDTADGQRLVRVALPVRHAEGRRSRRSGHVVGPG